MTASHACAHAMSMAATLGLAALSLVPVATLAQALTEFSYDTAVTRVPGMSSPGAPTRAPVFGEEFA